MHRQDMTWARLLVKTTEVGECLIWTGSVKPVGYGQIRHGAKTLYTHRVSWELHFGPVPEGMCVLHHCDVRRCVRPEHLFLGTKADNTADMMAKGRHRFRGLPPKPR